MATWEYAAPLRLCMIDPTGFITDAIFGKWYEFYRDFFVDFFLSGNLLNFEGTFLVSFPNFFLLRETYIILSEI